MLRFLKRMFASSRDAANPYAPPRIGEHEVELRVTQTQIDNEATVALDVPNLASVEIVIPSVTKDGFRIRIPDACVDGSTIVAQIHVFSENESHNKSVDDPQAPFDEQTQFCSTCAKQVKVDDDFRCTQCKWPV